MAEVPVTRPPHKLYAPFVVIGWSLEPKRGQEYKVAAVDVVGNVSAQSIALAVTTPDTIAPSVPTGIAGAAASAAQINLSWNASTDTGGSGLKGYKVFRNGSPVVTTTTTASTYSDTGLTASTTYSYAVGAYDVAGNMSAQSGPVSATTLSSAGGMFSFVSGSHTSVGSSGDIATATIKNAGTATITAIIASCYSANGVYHNYGNGVTTLAAGATALYQCQAAASGTYSVSISMQGTGAANTGASWSW